MKLTLDRNGFVELIGKSSYFSDWPCRARSKMFDMIEELEASTDTELEYDPAALACDFHKSTVADYVEEYLADDCEGYDPSADFEDQLDWLRDKTGLYIEDAESHEYMDFGKRPLFIYMGT